MPDITAVLNAEQQEHFLTRYHLVVRDCFARDGVRLDGRSVRAAALRQG